MSKRLTVQAALAALMVAALPGADHHALEDSADRPRRVSPLGTVVLRDGDPGDPEMDLSPPAYHYQHRFPVEILAYASAQPLRTVLDAMASAIGAAVAADPTLGGLCNHVDVTALDMVDLIGPASPGGPSQKGGIFEIIADYTTSNPLN